MGRGCWLSGVASGQKWPGRRRGALLRAGGVSGAGASLPQGMESAGGWGPSCHAAAVGGAWANRYRGHDLYGEERTCGVWRPHPGFLPLGRHRRKGPGAGVAASSLSALLGPWGVSCDGRAGAEGAETAPGVRPRASGGSDHSGQGPQRCPGGSRGWMDMRVLGSGPGRSCLV